LFQAFGWLGLRINASSSLPMGIYIEADESDVIEFCPPEPWGRFAAERGYRSRGVCRDGASPLLKPVVARAGDMVELSPAGIRVNDCLIPNTAPRPADSKSRTLTPYSFGTHRVEAGTVWLASSYSDRSFDSRYMGPIPTSAIRARLRPLVTLW
jgi:conjugative transfer signal peptidase TraF